MGLREVRQKLGLTQRQVAERIGRTTQAVSDLEKRGGPRSVRMAEILADRLGVPCAALLDMIQSTSTSPLPPPAAPDAAAISEAA